MNGKNYIDYSVTLTSTLSAIRPANLDRTALVIFNTGANDGQFTVGRALITVRAGDHVAFLDRPPINAIDGRSAIGTTFTVWEA